MSINDDVYSRMLKHRALLTLYEKRLDTEIDKILASHKIRLQRIVALSSTTNINVLTRKLNTEIRLTYKKIYKEGISELNKLAGVSVLMIHIPSTLINENKLCIVHYRQFVWHC